MRIIIISVLALAICKCVLAKNIHLDDKDICPPNNDIDVQCEKSVTIPCDSAGSIFSPGYNETGGSQLGNKGTYKLRFSAECSSILFQISLTEENVKLTTRDSLKMGEGDEIGKLGFLSVSGSESGIELGGKEKVEAITGDNKFWMDLLIDSSQGVSFAISYTILQFNSTEDTLTNSSGNITSPGFFSGAAYLPQQQISIIDVPESDPESKSLNITVDFLDIAGGYGDFLAIGAGTEPFEDEETILLSWKLESKRNIIIPGTKAYVAFHSFLKTNTIESKGYWISYQVIENILTTPAPPITTVPTTAAPDYSALETTVIVLEHSVDEWFGNNSVVRQQFKKNISEICNCYNNAVRTTEEDVIILHISSCYQGWWLNWQTCTQVETAVISETNDGKPAFPKSVLQEALKNSTCNGKPDTIKLPSEFTDVYFYAILAAVGVILLIVILLIGIWRINLKAYYKEQQEEFKIQSARMEEELEGRSASIASGGLNARTKPWKRGIENPNFVLDEDSGEAALEYDPEAGAAFPSSVYSWMSKPFSNSTSKNHSWGDEGQDSESEIYSQAAAPSVISNTHSSASRTGSTAASVQKRSILKKTSSNGLSYDTLPQKQAVSASGFEDVPLNGVPTPHIYEVPTAIQLLDCDDNSSIGETQL